MHNEARQARLDNSHKDPNWRSKTHSHELRASYLYLLFAGAWSKIDCVVFSCWVWLTMSARYIGQFASMRQYMYVGSGWLMCALHNGVSTSDPMIQAVLKTALVHSARRGRQRVLVKRVTRRE